MDYDFDPGASPSGLSMTRMDRTPLLGGETYRDGAILSVNDAEEGDEDGPRHKVVPRDLVPWIVVGIVPIAGTGIAVAGKSIYQEGGVVDGREEMFIAPLLSSVTVFLGMVLIALLEPAYQYWKAHRDYTKHGQHGLPPRFDCVGSYRRMGCSGGLCLRALVPAMCDMLTTVLVTFSLLFVSPSTTSSMRGASLLFSPLVAWALNGCSKGSVSSLDATTVGYERWGIAVSVAGVAVVSAGALLDANIDARDGNGGPIGQGTQLGQDLDLVTATLIGTALALGSSVTMSLQFAVESAFLEKKDEDLSPIVLASVEGLWGFVITLIMLIAANFIHDSSGAPLENTPLDFALMQQNPAITYLLIVQVGCVVLFAGALITMSSMDFGVNCRTFVFSTRPAIVFAFELLIFAASNGTSPLGEAPTLFWYLHVLGFVLIIAGGFITFLAPKTPTNTKQTSEETGEET